MLIKCKAYCDQEFKRSKKMPKEAITIFKTNISSEKGNFILEIPKITAISLLQ